MPMGAVSNLFSPAFAHMSSGKLSGPKKHRHLIEHFHEASYIGPFMYFQSSVNHSNLYLCNIHTLSVRSQDISFVHSESSTPFQIQDESSHLRRRKQTKRVSKKKTVSHKDEVNTSHQTRRKNQTTRHSTRKTVRRRDKANFISNEDMLSDVEIEMLQFMESSVDPYKFPTKADLLRAGRGDLVDAILSKGGWLTAGWDAGADLGKNVLQSNRVEHPNGTCINKPRRQNKALECNGKTTGLTYTYVDGLIPQSSTKELGRLIEEEDATFNQSLETKHKSLSKRNEVLNKAKSTLPKNPGDIHKHADNHVSIVSRIQGLETELISTLHLLQSRKYALAHDSQNGQDFHMTCHHIQEASDSLEFRETEVLNRRAELRKARAELTASEGKLALQLVELKKNIDEMELQLEQAKRVMKMFRTVRVVWPNPAVEVLLAGSFDGWSSKQKMQKSSAGVFITSLQLHPGRYEIKFIVNGEWRIDPNRPVTCDNGGFENNVLNIM